MLAYFNYRTVFAKPIETWPDKTKRFSMKQMKLDLINRNAFSIKPKKPSKFKALISALTRCYEKNWLHITEDMQ